MPQPNPYAPPSSPDDAAKVPVVATAREFALRRAWQAFGLWLVGLSLFNGALAGLALASIKFDEALIAGAAARGSIARGPDTAIASACLAATTFVHHRRAADVKAMGPMFTITPAAAVVASALVWLGSAIGMSAIGDSPGRRLFVGAWDAVRLFDVGLAFASSCAYAAILGPLATFTLPGLTKRMPTKWLRFFAVWLFVVFCVRGIDSGLHLLIT